MVAAAPLIIHDLPLGAEYPYAIAIPPKWQTFERRREQFGPWSDEALDAQLDVAHCINLLAQVQIENGRIPEACKNLVNVDNLTERPYPQDILNRRRLKLRGEMLHNYACVRKAQGKASEALRYAEKALDVMLTLDIMAGLPQCFLNLGTLLSGKGLHAEALKHSLLSLQAIKQLLIVHSAGQLPVSAQQTLQTMMLPLMEAPLPPPPFAIPRSNAAPLTRIPSRTPPPVSSTSAASYGPLTSSSQFRSISSGTKDDSTHLPAILPPPTRRQEMLKPMPPIQPLPEISVPKPAIVRTPSKKSVSTAHHTMISANTSFDRASDCADTAPLEDVQHQRTAALRQVEMQREKQKLRREQQRLARERREQREKLRQALREVRQREMADFSPEDWKRLAAARQRERHAAKLTAAPPPPDTNSVAPNGKTKRRQYRLVTLPTSNTQAISSATGGPNGLPHNHNVRLDNLHMLTAELGNVHSLLIAAQVKMEALMAQRRKVDDTPSRPKHATSQAYTRPTVGASSEWELRLPRDIVSAVPRHIYKLHGLCTDCALPGVELLLQIVDGMGFKEHHAASCIQRAVRVYQAWRQHQRRRMARQVEQETRDEKELEQYTQFVAAIPIQCLFRGYFTRSHLLPRKRFELAVKAEIQRNKAASIVQQWWRLVQSQPGQKAYRELTLSDETRGVEELEEEDEDDELISDGESLRSEQITVVSQARSAGAPWPLVTPMSRCSSTATRRLLAAHVSISDMPPTPVAASLGRASSPDVLPPAPTLRIQSQPILTTAPSHAPQQSPNLLSSLLSLPSPEEIISWGNANKASEDSELELYHPGGVAVDAANDPIGAKLMTLLALTYHNIAAEQEHLGEWDRCVVSYRVATLTAEDALGPGHHLSRKLRDALDNAQRARVQRDKLRALTMSGRISMTPRMQRKQWAEQQKTAVAAANLTSRPFIGGSMLRMPDTKPAQLPLTRDPYTGALSAGQLERRMDQLARQEQFALNQVERRLEAAAELAPLDPIIQRQVMELKKMRRRHDKELLAEQNKKQIRLERVLEGDLLTADLMQRQSNERRQLLQQLRDVLQPSLGAGEKAAQSYDVGQLDPLLGMYMRPPELEICSASSQSLPSPSSNNELSSCPAFLPSLSPKPGVSYVSSQPSNPVPPPMMSDWEKSISHGIKGMRQAAAANRSSLMLYE